MLGVALAPVVLGLALGVTVHQARAQQGRARSAAQAGASQAAGGQAARSQTASGQSVAGGGQAASTADVVPDIQVTGGGTSGERLQEQVLKRTPRSATVITNKVIEEEQIDTVTDLSRRVPGYRPNLVQPRQSRMTIRGVGIAAASAGTGSPSDTGYIVDNVYWSFAGFQWGDFGDLASIEVLYGPTGTAGAKNTNVGSIIIHTQLPSFEQKTTLRTSFGNYNRIKQTINSTGALINDQLAYRFSAYLDRGDGWIRDARTGSTYLDPNRIGAHFQLLGVGDDWSDRFSFIYNGSNEQNGYLTGTIGDTFLLYANGTSAKLFRKSPTAYRQTDLDD